MAGKTIPDLFELTIIRKDGKEIPIEITSAATTYEKKLTNVIYIRDIKDRKQAQEKHKAMIQTTADGFWVTDLEGKFLEINDAYCKMVGYTQEELLNMHIWDIEAVENPKDVAKHIKRLRERGYFHFETRHRRKDGVVIDVEVSSNYLDFGEGQVFSFLHDITKRKENENKLNQYREHLEEQVAKRTAELKEQLDLRAEFTRTLVHELKTPLTAILSSSEVLAGDIKDETLSALAENINRGGHNLENRIDELLDVAKMEIGVLKIKCKATDPLKLINEVVADITPEVSKKGQVLSLEMPDSLNLIYCDKERLRQIILNLVGNAIKFNRPYGKITFKAIQSDNRVIFTVTDEGKGIAIEEQENIFQPYYRIEKTRDRFGGLGLGLSIAKFLVELHKGRIYG